MTTETEFSNRPINQANLPEISDVDYQRHPKRYLKYILLTSSGPFLFILLGFLMLLLMGINMWAWIVLIGGIFIFGFVFLEEIKSFPIRGYALREHDVTYQKGWLFFSRITIPFNRIQHCEIAQGPLAQLFDLAELRIFTAGGSVSDLSIGGLPPDEAHRLREYIAKVSSIYE